MLHGRGDQSKRYKPLVSFVLPVLVASGLLMYQPTGHQEVFTVLACHPVTYLQVCPRRHGDAEPVHVGVEGGAHELPLAVDGAHLVARLRLLLRDDVELNVRGAADEAAHLFSTNGTFIYDIQTI